VSATWETSFVAVSVLLGEPLDQVTRVLGAAAGAPATELLQKLGGASREGRARALARVLSDVALAIDDARLA
jgi:hypothetical protein